jgi:hypothetical protein
MGAANALEMSSGGISRVFLKRKCLATSSVSHGRAPRFSGSRFGPLLGAGDARPWSLLEREPAAERENDGGRSATVNRELGTRRWPRCVLVIRSRVVSSFTAALGRGTCEAGRPHGIRNGIRSGPFNQPINVRILPQLCLGQKPDLELRDRRASGGPGRGSAYAGQEYPESS